MAKYSVVFDEDIGKKEARGFLKELLDLGYIANIAYGEDHRSGVMSIDRPLDDDTYQRVLKLKGVEDLVRVDDNGDMKWARKPDKPPSRIERFDL